MRNICRLVLPSGGEKRLKLGTACLHPYTGGKCIPRLLQQYHAASDEVEIPLPPIGVYVALHGQPPYERQFLYEKRRAAFEMRGGGARPSICI